MVESREIVELINSFSIMKRIEIIEEVLRGIKHEEAVHELNKEVKEPTVNPILEFAGIIDEEEADNMKEAIEDSRKVDENEW